VVVLAHDSLDEAARLRFVGDIEAVDQIDTDDSCALRLEELRRGKPYAGSRTCDDADFAREPSASACCGRLVSQPPASRFPRQGL
jgi:hypothetical protein